LNPVTFNWIDPNKGTALQLGFIAQQLLPVFPNLVSTTSPTALTPDGTLSLNYIGLISPIVSAIQQLDQQLTDLVKAYLQERLSVPLRDKTDQELLAVSPELGLTEQVVTMLAQVLSSTTEIKFARGQVAQEIMEQDMQRVQQIIELTMPTPKKI